MRRRITKVKGGTRQYGAMLCNIASVLVIWGLRDYGTASWEGGDADCDHVQRTNKQGNKTQPCFENTTFQYEHTCAKCGAVRVDDQLGLEETPELYVSKMVAVFREVRRLLRPDGVLWLNLGDSYAASSNTGGIKSIQGTPKRIGAMTKKGHSIPPGLKPKDLVGIPWRVAFALQQDGWWLRQDIIWHKPNPMPESVQDRCTKSHEYIFLMTKSAKYYYDNEAIMEKAKRAGTKNNASNQHKEYSMNRVITVQETRNKRSVWTIPTKPFKGAHFAVFPPELIKPCILAGSREKDIVLDPFAGSGTALIVAKKYGRQYLGIELNPDYIEMAEKRLKQESSLFDKEVK